ncbi:nucleotidyltransferase family protein [Chelatococcus reniformis]|nr:nucleotidyltransferase family protein [Chelatococcus reniformis]
MTNALLPIGRAMILAAGLGKRMRPITTTTPKPLVRVGGRALIDHAIDRFVDAGVAEVIVNVHYLPDLVETHLGRRKAPAITVSDERTRLLETGGGIKKALPLLGDQPFFVGNSDSLWIEGPRSNVRRLGRAWDPEQMDVLLLLASTATSIGYDGLGDFAMDTAGRLVRRGERLVVPFVYAGVAIVKPALFAETPDGPFSLNLVFDRALERGRLHGLRLDGQWLHVGTPDAVRLAEDVIANSNR